MSDLSGMVNHRKNDSRGKFAQQEALITNERVKQTEDEAERIHLTVGRMDTGYEINASLPNRFTVMCPHCHGQNFYSHLLVILRTSNLSYCQYPASQRKGKTAAFNVSKF